jgi:hypothetical protein
MLGIVGDGIEEAEGALAVLFLRFISPSDFDFLDNRSDAFLLFDPSRFEISSHPPN